MLIFFLIFHSFSLDNILDRKLMRMNPNFFGDWEFKGDLKFIENELIFYDGKQHNFGLYFSNKLPKEQWTASISLEFPKNRNISQLGIWFTKDFGVEGSIFGGQEQFTGFALLIAKFNKTMLIELRENDSKGKFSVSSFQPQTNLTLFDDENVSIFINYTENQRTSISILNNNQSVTIFDDIMRIFVKKYWFSITGMTSNYLLQKQIENDKLETLNDSNETINENIKDQNTEENNKNEINYENENERQIYKIKSIYFSSNSLSLEKPLIPTFEFSKPTEEEENDKSFNKTNNYKENEKIKPKNQFSTTVVDVLDEIDSVYKYSSVLSSKSFVNDVIFYNMFPFIDAWQRRSIQMTRKSPILKENISKIMKNTSIIIEQIGKEIDNDLQDLMKNINNVTAKLYYSIFYETDIEDSVAEHKEEFEGKGVTKLLFISSIIELVIFLLVIIIKWRV